MKRTTKNAPAARWAGRFEVEARTVWKVVLGTLEFRCIKTTAGFLVQSKRSNLWADFATGDDAGVLLGQIMMSEQMRKIIQLRTEAML